MATLSEIQGKAQAGNVAEAEVLLRGFLAELFGLNIAAVNIRKDTLSLNSVNGFVELAAPDAKTGAAKLFFKFHHEESEEGLAEYYNSEMLSEAGFPVEKPVYVSKEVGKQVLLYPVKTSERMADVCKRIELSGTSREFEDVVIAQERLDEVICQRYIASLHDAPPDLLREEPILQLFYYRLVDDKNPAASALGGRYKSFYNGQTFTLPEGQGLKFEELSKLKWRVNGVEYQETLEQAFNKALKVLSPALSKNYPAVVAHGDAHNGNVWYNKGAPSCLSLFDPAFAGRHVPALLAEIKPTFHNIFAHPLWLYDSRESDAYLDISCNIKDGYISVAHNWVLQALRAEFLLLKRDKLWIPLLRALKEKVMLPDNWQEYMRAALFCCPTLVMNLRAGAGTKQNSHTPKTSLLGLSIAMMLSSPPQEGAVGRQDIVSDFFSDLNNAIT